MTAPEAAIPARVDAIDWKTWQPTEDATLLFVIRDGSILLIHKLRGLGKGKINGPGGRVEPGETMQQCAVRETEEEIGVTPTGVEYAGRLHFQFVDGYGLRGEVFRASNFTGELIETDEAIPEWFAIDAIPYDRMWADDPVWFPHLLSGTPFTGHFIFDDDTMLDHRVVASEG
ncbi:MAG: 8-oxo-dGTP diphosphatase [Kiritimatiellia bacterium]|jgi:8-oxo-dGTP diphosphatase|nr:8-oxo-dGTP diphosphatase [Kiritimatiellia bacterium]MDP6629653.1 8-oxo-dGTP diphosphatase [Kiritimatiellia bacterium]MDP6811097.1 8-oxo-dGTP diphosphatase [Kiritimatiellia bacterium]MDP7024442.1 8-oxo-dGTP diphosphatase [Kiritimatiellia bacterium]